MIDPKSRQEAAETLRARAQELKKRARASDAMTAPMLWIRAADLETLAQKIEDELSETPEPRRP